MSLISSSSLNLSKFLTGPNSHFYHRSLNICKCRASLSQPYFSPPSSCLFKEEIIVEGGEDIGDERKGLRLKWHDVGPDLTEAQKHQMSQLSPTMTNRCKAIMRRIICLSQEENLFLLLASWVKAMQPRRCDWLSVLKEIKRMDVSLFFEVMEYCLLEESFEPNARDYTKLIHTYAKHNRLQDAQNTFQSMKTLNLPSDQVTLTVLINLHSKAGDLRRAEESFHEIKLLNSPIDNRSYGAMIMAYIRAKKLNLAETLMQEMESQQVFARREVYKAVLRAFSMAGDAAGAQRAFDAAQFAGIVPDGRICALLVNAYCAAGEVEGARSAVENMRVAGVKPNDKCVALMLGAYREEEKLERALDFLMGLERDGVVVEGEAAEVLVKWFREIGVVGEVELAVR